MATVKIPGFKQYTTNPNPRSVDDLDVTRALNVYWSGNTLVMRDGCSLWKNDVQANWGRIAKAITYKRRADNFFYVVVAMTNGRVFFIESDDPNFGGASATWTELESYLTTFPALTPNANKYSMFVFNNILYFADSTSAYYSWDGTAAGLTLETDPPSLAGNNIVDFDVKSNRLVALDDGGRTHLSAINDGTDFTTVSGGGNLNYGRVEGLIATNVVSFNDDLIVTTEDRLSVKYQAYRLSGIQFFDPAVTGTDTSQFEVRKINTAASIIGESGQEIVGDTIGLSRNGFVSLLSVVNKETITERDYLSYPIKELIRQINFQKSDKISSTTDIDGRYYCAVPFGDDSTEANVIFCYDFRRSSVGEGINRWSLLTFAGITEIGALFTIQGQAYACDIKGNIFKLNDGNTSHEDEDEDGNKLPINTVVKTASIGGQEMGLEKDFGSLTFLLTSLYEDLAINVDLIVDGKFYDKDIYGVPYPPINVELSGGALLYDTPGLLYDDFHLYDSGGSDQKLVTLIDRGGRANSIQWQFSTNTKRVSWGLGGFSIDVEAVETTNSAGANNSGVI
jgi:hypothetical protein